MLFKPTWLIEKLTAITPEQFKTQGISSIILDLDNTLLRVDNPLDTSDMQAWVETLKREQLQVIVLSNNVTKHVEKYVRPFKLPFVANAKKPLPFGVKKALEKIKAEPTHTVLIGDQLFTDILAGHWVGIRTILVKPLGEKDFIFTKCIRWLERKCLNYLLNHHQLTWAEKIN